MKEPIYNKKTMDHIINPKNGYEMENPDGLALVGDPGCGDTLKLYVKVENNVITETSFQVVGCGAAIASASATTVLLKGKTLEEARNITNQHIVDFLGGLPPEKIHCSVMAKQSIEKALDDYKSKIAALYAGQDHTYPFLFGNSGQS
ncbi:MAG: iron-sulfur cluster assembly scaffold protein [Vulcanimicrobiota bacterium]